jgi:hypothetical protein
VIVARWIARTAMLALATLATLALIGSLASVSDSTVGDVFPGAIPAPAEPGSETIETTPAEPTRADETRSTATPATGAAQTVAAPPPSNDAREIARWLKALTYAVLALAVIAAAGVIALVRIGGRISPR